MPVWLQNLLVVLALGASAAFLFRGAFRALKGRKSGLGGCGVCSGCASTPAKATTPASERIVMVPTDALIRSSKSRAKRALSAEVH